MKNILLTGASGFVGQNFIKYSKGLQIHTVSLRETTIEKISFENITCIVHLAALVHQMKGAPEEQYYAINTDLTLNLALTAKRAGVGHFVFMSTVKVYGESTTKEIWNENSACEPTDAYGKSKLLAEKKLLALQDSSFKVAIIRTPLVYGAQVKGNMISIIKLVDKLPILPLGGIQNRRSMVSVDNLSALILHVISQQASGIFLASDKEPISTTMLVKTIANHLNKKTILFKIPSFFILILSKIKPAIIDRLFGSLEINNKSTLSQLGFQPPHDINDSIAKMVDWYKRTN